MRGAAAVVALVVTAGCSPSESDYAGAIERNWAAEQQAQRDRAAFLANHASSFERSAERSAEITRRLGTDNELSDGARWTADNARVEQEEAENIADAEFVRARDISCAPASPLPGENCEATVTVRGQDGREQDFPAAWRFDELNSRIEIVGAMER